MATQTLPTPRWSKFQGISKVAHCGVCTGIITEDDRGVALYHDDQPHDGSLIPTTYYHDACVRHPGCGRVVFTDMQEHRSSCPRRAD